MKTRSIAFLVTGMLALNLYAADWPMWKHNPGRTAVSPAARKLIATPETI